mmetsp:Transcript_98020/g.204456  ORF Transcript_98020/g.204456 Transcript_98020/m.204456 type:complete len:651 (-) Transcript_98020:411-2363(-)|eukprot:CAMPEP_0206446828 /NCGR_PEP_ID=MMETSP0324_2-20121206/16384_1 /ASSEMBLY_ACC=CAM_ASM_000836 /TAXON_ID=2866 /ORGANISM="Crypthecodinium cohnii, Strain Seligo" /LENGTH=650 /DNA_ID=CAMNT_0053915405 /DNA_START=57 /DNA_END=2009 /DNA_ORIENTATION=-
MPAEVATVSTFLQRRLQSLPESAKTEVLALHKKYRFDDEFLDAFEANNGSLSADNVSKFDSLLLKESVANNNKANTPHRAMNTPTGTKRSVAARAAAGALAALGAGKAKPAHIASPGQPGRTQIGSPNPSSTQNQAQSQTNNNGLNQSPAAGGADDLAHVTPAAKRSRQDDLNITPDFTKKTVEVSVKSSTNEQIALKTSELFHPVAVELLGDAKLWSGERHGTYTWMDESLEDQAMDRDRRLAELEQGLCDTLKNRHPELEEFVVGVVGVPGQAEVALCGRVLCEGLEGRLNERSMLLEGQGGASKGARVQLNASGCPQLAAFPGQLVAVLGRTGTTGTTFHARDFVPGLSLPSPTRMLSAGQHLHAVVVAGPYCSADSLDYSPLRQALEHAVQTRPQVLFMLGPFVDANNRKIAQGEVTLPGNNKQDNVCSFEDIYSEVVLPILRKGIHDLKRVSPQTEVLVVPSLEEVLNFHPMPQPPLDATLGHALGSQKLEPLSKLGVRFVPNPAHLSVGGLRVSVTSGDALSSVLRSGLVLRPQEKPVEQAFRLLLQQRSLFPVLPRDPAQVSEARAAALDFPTNEVPDIILFPSANGANGGHFVDNRLFVNPGPLCKPTVAGTFAEIVVVPGAPNSGAGLTQRARVDIKSFLP